MNPSAAASPFSAGSLVQLTLSLVLIVGLIFGLSWLLKRMRIGASRSRGAIRVIDELALSPRDRVVLVGVGAAQVLVGVGAGGLVALAPLAAPLVQDGAAPPDDGMLPGGFADRLRELIARQGRDP